MKRVKLTGVGIAVIGLFLASLLPAADVQSAPRGQFKRTVERYEIPDVMLLNQDGRKIKLKSVLDPGKPVVIDFIYTTCTTICPVLSANFVSLQNRLGDSSETVQLVSISIDPEYDRPERMKKYLTRFRARKGWDFLTGSRDDIDRVLKALDASVPDKMSHTPLYILRGSRADEWVRLHGMIGASDLMDEVKRLQGK